MSKESRQSEKMRAAEAVRNKTYNDKNKGTDQRIAEMKERSARRIETANKIGRKGS